MYVGSTWNVSIFLFPNSTSGLKFQFGTIFGGYYSYWEGPREFEVTPNQNYTVTYIQHHQSDAVVEWFLNYTLLESSMNASGTYSFFQTNYGYPAAIGTGEIYVVNITAWLETRDLTTSTTSTTTTTTESTSSLGFITILLGITVVQLRRRPKR
jgi:hypothetical protein